MKELGHVNATSQEKLLKAYMLNNNICPWMYAAENGLYMALSEDKLHSWVEDVIAKNISIVADVKKGKINAIEKLMGQVMKLSEKTANPKEVREMLLKKIQNIS